MNDCAAAALDKAASLIALNREYREEFYQAPNQQ